MNRREFLRTSAIATVAVAANPFVKKLSFAQTSNTFEIQEATIMQLQDGMKSGMLTARWIAETYLKRIEEIDKNGPAINSVIQTNPDALEIADALDRERKEKGPRGPLHGIPILIKDNIDTADGMMTTAGSLALVGSKPPRDSSVAQKLREAGAVIIGKTNLSEWANIRSSHSTSGWSGRGGQTKNPYALDRNPCGSSSGSGAAAAASLCAAAVGTETDGSVVCPSSACSLVGIKPTLGLITRAGIIPIAHSQDTAGPMARSVTDAAILLGALAGADSRDPATQNRAGKTYSDYTRFLVKDGLRGARLGIARKYFNNIHDRIQKQLDDLIGEMKKMGAVIVDPTDIPTSGQFDDSELLVMLYELKADLNAYLATLGPSAPVRSLKDVIDFNEKNADREMPHFGQDLFIKAEAKGPLTTKEYLKALKKDQKLARHKGLDFVLQKNKLDAMIAPTGGLPWFTDWINGDAFSGGYSSASAVAGYPHITVPAGYAYGLPFGISFFGGAYSEPTLLKIAYAFEQATNLRRAPQFLPTANPNQPVERSEAAPAVGVGKIGL